MVKIRPGATSAIAYLWIEEKTGARSCAWTREGLDELTADEIDAEAVAHARILHLDGHNAAGAIAAAKVAREAGVLVNYDAGTHRDGMNELLALADILICSEEFILKLTGLDDAEAATKSRISWRGDAPHFRRRALRSQKVRRRPRGAPPRRMDTMPSASGGSATRRTSQLNPGGA